VASATYSPAACSPASSPGSCSSLPTWVGGCHGGKPAVAPLIDIPTIFNNQAAPKPIEAGPFGPDNVVVGLVTHITLSMIFGIAFALLAAMLLILIRADVARSLMPRLAGILGHVRRDAAT